MDKNTYWHFLPDNGCLRWGTKEKVKVKHTLMLPIGAKIILCQNGYHASKRAIDALSYAPGSLVCLVTLHGKVLHDTDKSVAEGRTVLAMADATETIRAFARWCALSVIHLWDAPKIVYDYLNTGNETIRAAAWDAAWYAARAAARDAQNTKLEPMLHELLGTKEQK